jgi:hypothetical protein
MQYSNSPLIYTEPSGTLPTKWSVHGSEQIEHDVLISHAYEDKDSGYAPW